MVVDPSCSSIVAVNDPIPEQSIELNMQIEGDAGSESAPKYVQSDYDTEHGDTDLLLHNVDIRRSSFLQKKMFWTMINYTGSTMKKIGWRTSPIIWI